MDKMKRVFSFVLVLAMLVGSFSSFSTVAFAEETKVEAKDGDVKVEVKVEKEEAKEVKEEVKTETKADDTKVLNNVPKDVIGTDYEAAVTRLVAFGVIGGYPDGTYKPEEEINRAQFAKIVVMALGLNDAVPAAANKSTGFSDVQPGYWAAGYINVATGQGLLKGYPDGTFRPAKKVSYAETLTMLVRALGYQDEFLPGNWPGNYVAKAAEAGITAGVQMPGDAKTGAKRGPVAQMVNNAFDAKVVKVDKYKPNTKEVEYYETDITLLKDKLEISKYENTRIVSDKIVDDGLAKDEIRVRFLESVDRYGKNDTYKRGEVVKRAYEAGDEDTYRHNDFVAPRTVIGEEVTTYVNENDKVVYLEKENDDKAYFDYVQEVKDGKLSLVALDKDVKFDDQKDDTRRRTDRATVNLLKVKDDKFEILDTVSEIQDLNEKGLDDLAGRMGKFVIKNNRIVYAEIIQSAEADGFMVAMKNDKGLIEGVNNVTSDFKKDLRDDKDYDKALVHDTKGNAMSIEDIKEGNLLYIDQLSYDGDDVANVVVVRDNEVKGEMGKVKTDKVEIAGKETKVTKFTAKGSKEPNYVARYAVNDLEEVKEWMTSDWEDDMEDAYKETVVAYKDGAGRIAFLTTDNASNSGYKFGIVTRTYSDGDRVRIFSTIDGKEGKDQIFKSEKDIDVDAPYELDKDGQETKTRTKADSIVGRAVKFRLNSDGEIAKDKMFVMPTENVYAMTDDFGKDIIKAVKVNSGDDFKTSYKNAGKATTFAVNSDTVVAIDAPKVGIEFATTKKVTNLDDTVMKHMDDKAVDVDDFNVTTWKEIKEDKFSEETRFYAFPKNNKSREIDGLVFIGHDGANTGSDEIAVYVLDQWKTGDKLKVEYISYENNTKQTREVDNEDKLVLDQKEIKKETAYVGKEKSNGKIGLYGKLKDSHTKTKDFEIYRDVKVDKVNGNYITVGDKEFLTSGALIYDEDKSKSVSYLRNTTVDIVTDGIRARVIGVKDNNGSTTGTETSKEGTVTYINTNEGLIEVDGKVLELDSRVRLKDSKGNTMGVGPIEVATKLKEGNKVDITEENGIVTEIKLVADKEDPVDPEDPTDPETEIKVTARYENVMGMMHTVYVKVEGADLKDVTAITIDGDTVDFKPTSTGNEIATIVNGAGVSEAKVTIDGEVYTVAIK